jgi:hypothetical protein
MFRRNQIQRTQRRRRNCRPRLRFTPWAWAKLLYLRDLGSTEVGGFGITNANNPLFVEDLILIQQSCSPVTVAFHDDAVAEFFDAQIDAGRRPENFGRIWIHTHPSNSAEPSHVDEETFARVFGRCDWAVMAILARGGQNYVRLQYQIGPGGSLIIPLEVDYQQPFAASDWPAWKQEYATQVTPDEIRASRWFGEFLIP